MTDPYAILGIPSNATDEQVKEAYRKLARKYHPDNYANNPLADLAQEKMKQINEAYDTIQRQRQRSQTEGGGYQRSHSGQSSYGGRGYGRSQFSDIRTLIATKRFSEAEELLEGVPQSQRDGEWHFLRGNIFYSKGWLDEAYRCYVHANQLEPANQEYQAALNRLLWQRNTGRPAGGYGDYRRTTQAGGCSGCDICTGLVCADCCCECMGGDLINCC